VLDVLVLVAVGDGSAEGVAVWLGAAECVWRPDGEAAGRVVGGAETAGRVLEWPAGRPDAGSRVARLGRRSRYVARVSRKNAPSATVERRIRGRVMGMRWARRSRGLRAR
jgi:hypothetical protein